MYYDIPIAALILLATVLGIWWYWPRRGVVCDECGHALVGSLLDGAYLCDNCVDRRLTHRAPPPGGTA